MEGLSPDHLSQSCAVEMHSRWKALLPLAPPRCTYCPVCSCPMSNQGRYHSLPPPGSLLPSSPSYFVRSPITLLLQAGHPCLPTDSAPTQYGCPSARVSLSSFLTPFLPRFLPRGPNGGHTSKFTFSSEQQQDLAAPPCLIVPRQVAFPAGGAKSHPRQFHLLLSSPYSGTNASPRGLSLGRIPSVREYPIYTFDG